MISDIALSLRLGGLIAEPVPAEVINALTAVQVTTAAGHSSGFQLTFALSKQSVIARTMLPQGMFDPPSRVQIVVTLSGSPTVLMDGVITRHEVTASNEPGQSKLTITGEDVSRMMDIVDFSGFPFTAMPPEARVAMMCGKYAMYGLIPLIVPSIFLMTPNPLDELPTQEGTDLGYIKQLAEQVGYVFYIEPGPVPGVNTAYWGPEVKVGQPQPALVANGDSAGNVESLSFSFDGFASTQYVVLIQEKTTKFPIPIPVPGINPIDPPLGLRLPAPLRISPLHGLGKYTPLQAGAIALARAAASADVVTGQGTLDVLRYGQPLQARRLVRVEGAGLDHDGLHYVTSVTHTIKRGEYKQSFNLSRNAFVPFPEGATA